MAEDERRLVWRRVGEGERLVVHGGGQSIEQRALKLLPLRGEDVKGQAPSQRHFHQLAARRRKDKGGASSGASGGGSGGGGGSGAAPSGRSSGVLCADVIASNDASNEAAWADLDRLLTDRSGLHAFRSFLEDEASEHCLNFYLACKFFAAAPSSSTPELAAVICDSFFGPDAPFPVRVSWVIANRALSSVRGASASFFHLAVDEARFLLARQYSAFLQSPQFAGLADATRLGHRRAVTVDLKKEVSQFLTLPSSPTSPRRSKSSRTKHVTASRRSKSMAGVVGRLRSRRKEGAPTKSMFTPYRHTSKKERDRSVLSRDGAVLRVAAHSWRIHQHVDTDHATTGVFRFYDKIDRTGAVATTLLSARRDFSLRRGIAWKPPNTRPAKLLHTLRDMTDVASSRHPVLVHALEAGMLLTAYQDGSVAVAASRFDTGNVTSAILDRSISTKLAEKQYGVIASAVCISDGVIVFTLTHSSVIGVATLYDPSVLRRNDSTDPTTSSASRSFSESTQGSSQRAIKGISFQHSFVDRPGAFLSVHRTIVLQWWTSQRGGGGDNVCVYVVPDTQQLVRLRQFSVPHHIHTLCTSRLDPRTVYVLQRGQPTQHGFSYTLSRCSMRHSEDVPTSPRSQPQRPVLEQRQAVNLALPCPVVICAVSPDDSRAVVVTRRGDVHLVCIDANTATSSVVPRAYSTETAAQDPVHVAWHPSSALFAVASRRGVLACYDRALNPVRLALSAEGASPLPYLDISHLGLEMSGIAGAYWLPAPPPPARPHQQEGPRALYDSRELVLLLSGSPPVVLRFECSAVHDGSGDTVLSGLCMNHLRSGDVRRAARLAREMEWTAYADSCFHVLSNIFEEVLKWPLSDEACNHAMLAVPAFAWDPEQTETLGLKTEKMRIHALLWRMFEYLVSNGALMRALVLATRACSRDMCRALATATEHSTTPAEVIVHAVATRAQHLAAVQLGQAPESTV